MDRLTSKVIIISALITTLYANKHEEAKELFDEAQCISCHNVEDFAPREKKVNSFAKLHKSVEACQFGNDSGWFDDETLNVSKYLNHQYYKFKEEKTK